MNRRSFLFGLAALPFGSMTPPVRAEVEAVESAPFDIDFPYQRFNGIVWWGESRTWVWTDADWKDIKAIPPVELIFEGRPKPEDSPA